MADAAYPGDEATPEQVQALADEYRKAAQTLLANGQRGKPLTRAPFRLMAIHAVELYLNVFLMTRDHAPKKVRGLQHDLVEPAKRATEGGLKLRKRTLKHLHDICSEQEYVASRYGPERAAKMSPPNRVLATLEEVAIKVKSAALKSEGAAASVSLAR